MRNSYIILLLSFISITGFSQEREAFNFDLYRTISNDLVIDLTQEDRIIYDEEFDNVFKLLARKEEMSLGYFHFTLDQEIDSSEISTRKTILFADFVRNLRQEIGDKNAFLKKKKIRKAVSLDNAIYTPIFIKLKNDETIKYYKAKIRYQEIIF